MDSLITSAIALAAGGWQNVKLAGIYTYAATSIPAWKLGICSINSISASSNGSIAYHNVSLIGPGTKIENIKDSQHVTVELGYSAITSAGYGFLYFTAVLFTWD